MSFFRVFDGMFRIVMGLIVIGWIAFMIHAQSQHQYFMKSAEAGQGAAQSAAASDDTVRDLAVDPYAVANDPATTQYDPYVARPDDVQGDDYTPPDGDWGQ